MKTGGYRFRPRARKDVEGIWRYTRRHWGQQQACSYLGLLRDVCAELARAPELGKERDDLAPGLRMYPAGRHLVFYLSGDGGIEVVRVLHERMDFGRHLP